MKKAYPTMTRRQIIKTGLCAGAGLMVPWSFDRKAYAAMLADGLSDPAWQPKPRGQWLPIVFLHRKNTSIPRRYTKNSQMDGNIAAIALDSTGLKRFGRDE